MWISYEEIRNHPPDFLVKYRFLTIDEGGRNCLPYQGYRSDFAIEADFNKSSIELRVIHPEFEDINGKVILEKTITIPNSGIARMWILLPESRDRHRNELVIGMKGYFMEGNKKVAEAEIIEIIGLHTNPSNA